MDMNIDVVCASQINWSDLTYDIPVRKTWLLVDMTATYVIIMINLSHLETDFFPHGMLSVKWPDESYLIVNIWFILWFSKLWFHVVFVLRLVYLFHTCFMSTLIIFLFVGLVETDPEDALAGFAEVVRMEQEKADW